ncbi:(Fe-S)-binding protein [Amphritea sp. 1_MG-2023]|uniref:(Fe-S)-binding protein n=1 Tax=Amphritea sp. 1_MG-2023 TaxID=3062670 RepID=UPI0026E2DB32|nr:(Fe-S)-binding protein [Amphritea sp. 1_MG-2023]MDO6564150.1 (Fe-S)-binding protein [Amphritea sp. 1_MG-2023]
MSHTSSGPRVGLFVTCLADMFRPSVAFATVQLLEQAGCRVEVPERQTCCGQPAFNSGDRQTTADIARQTLDAFDGYEYVVAPSGSCIGMLHQYSDLFDVSDPYFQRAKSLAARAHEITSFLFDVLGSSALEAQLKQLRFEQKVTYHDSCAGLRELGIKQQPRQLLSHIQGVELEEMDEAETCCGFGGTFCVKYPEVSNRMVSNKSHNISNTDAQTLLGGDLGCLLNMAGKLKREGKPIEARHVVEVLAGMTDTPAIGEADYYRAKQL